MHELVNAIDEFENNEGLGLNPIETLRAFLDRSALLASTDAIDDTIGAVTLMTVHSSKGLEFDTVFLAGMEDELFPSLREETEEELEEERRLAYVAITRAKRKLYLSFAHRRRRFGEYRDSTPSQFLRALDPARLEEDPRSARSPYRGGNSYGYGGRRDAGRTYGRQNIGRETDAWHLDQSPQMIRGAISQAVDADLPAYDEVGQEPAWDDLSQEAWAPERDAQEDLVGRHCAHTKLGPGEIVAVSGTGDMATLTIEFADGQKRVKRKFVKIW